MASAFFGLNRGTVDLGPDKVVYSATTTGSTDVELRVDLTKGLTKNDINLLVVAIMTAVLDARINTAVIL